jgi:hypothetical protein
MHSDPTPPPRLKDGTDPLAQALADESLAVGAYDLDGLRGRVLDGAKGAPPPSPGATGTWWKIAIVSGITASLLTFGLTRLVPAPEAPVATHPSTQTYEPVVPSIPIDPAGEVVPRSTEEADGDVDVDAEGLTAAESPVTPTTPSASAPASPEPPITPTPVEPEPAAITDAAEPAERPSDAEPPSSQLAAELADYNRGVDFDTRQDWNAALAAWDVYLERWPEGRLHTEAQLGRLRALVGLDAPARVERLAAELLATPGLQAQRDDLLLTRAEALVKLDRCTEASNLLANRRRSGPGFDRVQAVRSTCRRR